MFKKVLVMFVLFFLVLTSASGCKKANVSEEHSHQGMTELEHQH